MNIRFLHFAPVLTLALLAGCASGPGTRGSASPTETQAAPPSGMQAKAARDARAMPAAALSLAEAADRAARARDWPQASRQLERALNIAPRNPLLWQRLAAVRYSQGEYRQAETCAFKSNGYAVGDAALQRMNWRIIGASRNALGDKAGAAQAQRRAEAL
jgi:tetratricopeptide (TPR) repeat protein